MNKCRKSIPYINHFISSKYYQHPVQDNQCQERAGHHRPSLSPPVKHLNTNKYKWHNSSVRIFNINHTSIHNLCKYLNQSRCHQEETHHIPNRFQCSHVKWAIEQRKTKQNKNGQITIYVNIVQYELENIIWPGHTMPLWSSGKPYFFMQQYINTIYCSSPGTLLTYSSVSVVRYPP